MKPISTKTILAIMLIVLFNVQINAQKDTTEFEFGKKKLIVVDKKIQQENAIYNLEKGKETFESEIKNAKKLIAEHEVLIVNAEKQIQSILKKLELEKQKPELEKQRKELEKQRLELEKQRLAIEKHRAIINANKKKKFAFESGIVEINKGIREIENGLVNIDEEIETMTNAEYSKTSTNFHNKRRFNAHWAGFEFGILNFVNKNQSLVSDNEVSFMKIVPEKTFSYGLNIFELNIPFTKYSLGLATGAGLRWNSISLEQNINLVKGENDIITGEPINVNIDELKKNKLNIAYIKIPVVLEYQIPVKRQKLYIGAGVFGEIRGWSKQRQKYVINNITYKDKTVDDFQLSPFRYGISARVGYGDIGVFVEYVLVPLFKDEKGPEIYPVMIGLRLVDF